MELIHTCYRITDIDRSVAFYEALGFDERRQMTLREVRSTSSWACPATTTGSSSPGTPASSATSSAPATATSPSRWTDIHATLERLAELGIEPEKPPYSVREGGSLLRSSAIPDGYRIELIERKN